MHWDTGGPGALFAERFAGVTDSTTVEDEQVREIKPVLLRYDSHEFLLNLDWIFLCRPAEATHKTTDMGINNKTLDDTKGIAQYYICGLACNTWQREEILHRAGYLSSVNLNYALPGSTDIFGLVAIETRRLDILFKLFLAGCGVVSRCGIFLKEVLRNDVDTLIGTLGRELGRDQ